MKKFVEEPDFLGLGLLRPWQGALIGILSALFLGALSWIGFFPLVVGLLYPGYLVFLLIDSLAEALPLVLAIPLHYVAIILGFGVSIIFPATLGSLIISKRMIYRTSGILLLVMHIALSIYLTFFFFVLYD